MSSNRPGKCRKWRPVSERCRRLDGVVAQQKPCYVIRRDPVHAEDLFGGQGFPRTRVVRSLKVGQGKGIVSLGKDKDRDGKVNPGVWDKERAKEEAKEEAK